MTNGQTCVANGAANRLEPGDRVRSALQINVHPLDVRHMVHTLDHQLKVWGPQVERISITVDNRRSQSGRYRGVDYDACREWLCDELARQRLKHSHLDVVEVDYSPDAVEEVRQAYFGGETLMPLKAFDGGPFYAYFFGLKRAKADYVVHMDSDMLFGGGSPTWLAEAMAWFERDPDALFVSPFPGPPRRDGSLKRAHTELPGRSDIPAPNRLDVDYPAYAFQSVSTRIFVFHQRRFDARVGTLALVRPSVNQQIRARLFRESPLTVAAEEVLTDALMRHRLKRIDFLGAGNGLYSLHPVYRSKHFYDQLPRLIEQIETGDIPEGQRGDHDVNSSMMDWSEALQQRTALRRAQRAVLQLGVTWLGVGLSSIFPLFR